MTDGPPEDDSIWPRPGVIVVVGLLAFAVFAGLLTAVSPLLAALSAMLFFAMALVTLTDLRHFIVPDVISLPAIPLGLFASAVVAEEGWQTGVTDGLAGALIGGGAFYLLRIGYFRYRNIEGLGLGDVKLAAVAGAWLGAAALAPACLAATLAALIGVLIHGLFDRGGLAAHRRIPFGSFIAPVIFAFWLARLLDLPTFW